MWDYLCACLLWSVLGLAVGFSYGVGLMHPSRKDDRDHS